MGLLERTVQRLESVAGSSDPGAQSSSAVAEESDCELPEVKDEQDFHLRTFVGRDEMLEFYGRHFIPKMPADTRLTPVCRTVGQGRVIDEMIFAFTHDITMDWMLPGVAPTGRQVEVPLVVVVQLREGQVVCERIYWDQASVLVQLGLLDASSLPVIGTQTARKVLDPSLPSNELIRRAGGG